MDNNDFECNKYKSTKMKLVFINELIEKCGCIGVTLHYELNDANKIIYMKKYNKIFRYRDQTINMNTLFNLRKIFIKTVRSVLGSNYMTSKRVGKDKTYEYSINNDCVEYHMTIYKFREQNKRDSTPVPTKKLFKKEKTECPVVEKEIQKNISPVPTKNLFKKAKTECSAVEQTNMSIP